MGKSKVIKEDVHVSPPEAQGVGDQTPAPMSTIDELEANASKLLDDPDYDPMSAPATLFGLYGVHLFRFVDSMSNKQLKRLIKVLVTYPLEDIKINKKNALEYEAYKIADRMLQSKYLMQLIVYHEEEEKRRQALAQQASGNAEKTETNNETEVKNVE